MMLRLLFKNIAIFLICAGLQAGCSSDDREFSRLSLPIINGTPISGDDYLSTVGIVLELNPDDYHVFCTGTLIAQDYVLTAAHCVKDCEDDIESVEKDRPRMRIGIGQSERTYRYVAEIGEFHVHPDYYCKGNRIKDDIAVLKLSSPIPEDVVKHAYPMSSALDITSEMVDSENELTVTRTGFGRTDAADPLSLGRKYKTETPIHARCPIEGNLSAQCGKIYTKDKGFLYFKVSETGTCQGDSGGPVLYMKNGIEFVLGVTSFGYDDCLIMDAASIVSDYEEFIGQFVPMMTELPTEICGNAIDDDLDGKADCEDTDCTDDVSCLLEICDNGKDDDLDGKADCEDTDCTDDVSCLLEICDNGKDDDLDGKADCEDTDCVKKDYCRIPQNEPSESSSGASGCSMQPKIPHGLPWILGCFLIFYGCMRRRKRTQI